MARLALLAILGLASSALAGEPAAASRYRYGAARDRVLAVEPHAVTHGIARDFEVQDGLGVLYVRAGARRVARLVSPALAARLYPDRAPKGAPDGVITAGDAWLARGTDARLDRMLLASARRLLQELLPRTTWLGLDPLSSAIVQISEDGGVVGRHAYGPFGRVLASSGDADRHGFSGQDRDASGTLHFQFRQLDPMTGRWLSSDPLFAALDAKKLPKLGESSSAYAYVGNDPVNHVDPTGLIRYRFGHLSTEVVRAVAKLAKSKTLMQGKQLSIFAGHPRLEILMYKSLLDAGEAATRLSNLNPNQSFVPVTVLDGSNEFHTVVRHTGNFPVGARRMLYLEFIEGSVTLSEPG